jgi:hypothetical protein
MKMIFVISVLVMATFACNLVSLDSDSNFGGSDSTPPLTQTMDAALPANPTSEPTTQPPGPLEVCLPSETGQTQYINEAGGYCFLMPEGFEITQDFGLDIFVAGPTLAIFGQEGLVLTFDISVVGAPMKAGIFTAQEWGAQIVEEKSAQGAELSLEPFTFSGAGLEGVRVAPLPGMGGGEMSILRTNDTLYSISVHPDRIGFPEYAEQVEELWEELSSSLRFFTPEDMGVEFKTAEEVCPQEQADMQLVIRYSEGWCVLFPEGWSEDWEFNFPGRFLGGPEIEETWPGQPQYTSITIGFYLGSSEEDFEQRVAGRINANGRPDLIERSERIVGGGTAVILDTRDGPLPERVALILANGYEYSILAQPFDASVSSEAQEALETAWDTVINSIQFFEPYQ